MSSFVSPTAWRCPQCASVGDPGHCCQDADGRAYSRVPVFAAGTTDEQLRWSIPSGPCAAHLVIDRQSGEIRTAGLAVDVRLGAFGPECHSVPRGAPEGIVAFIEKPPAESGWFYGYALDSSDELSNPRGPFASEEEAMTAAGYPGRYVEYPPHLVCGMARRWPDGRLYVGSLLLTGW